MPAVAVVHVNVSSPYDVTVEPGLLTGGGARLRAISASQRCGVVSDDTVAPLHLGALETSLRQAGFEPIVAVIPSGERHKTLQTVAASRGAGALRSGRT